MATVYFSHPHRSVGLLSIDNGIDSALWSYNLNTQVYPTYGGEVVQILSVFIDDITISGTCATYDQAEAIYSYFAAYMQIATQGRTGTVDINNNSSYNLEPMKFRYPERGWDFSLYPNAATGFTLDTETVTPVWQLSAHINDESNELTPIKQAIKDAAVSSLMANSGFDKLNDQISPNSGNPNSDPFQTFNEGDQKAEQALGNLADYYSSLVNGYQQGDFESLTGGLGSKPTKTKKKSASGVTGAAGTTIKDTTTGIKGLF